MKRLTKITGIALGVGAGVAAIAWMLKDRLVRPTPLPDEAPPTFRVSPPPTAVRPDADDLALIRGIGPVFKARLAAAGVSRFDELGRLDPERIAEIAGVPVGRAAEWVEQARSLV